MGKQSGGKGMLSGKWTVLPYCAISWFVIYFFCTIGGSRLREMLFSRGLIPHIIVAVASMGLGHLIYRYIGTKLSQRNLALISNEIRKDHSQFAQFASSEELPVDRSSAFTRLLAKVPEGREKTGIIMLLKDMAQAGQDFALKRLDMFIDVEAQESQDSFSIPQVLAWTVPMLGFLGTVWGISRSLSNFTGIMGDVDKISEIKTGLGIITAGLGVAFDTTLLGIFFGIVLTGMATYVHRRDSSCLQELERIALELLRTLAKQKPAEAATAPGGPVAMQHSDDLPKSLDRLRQEIKELHGAGVWYVEDMRKTSEELQDFAKALVAVAKQSNTMVEERAALERAAQAICQLDSLSKNLENHAHASLKLLEAVRLLKRPREFRLVEQFISPGEDGDGVPFHCDHCNTKGRIPRWKLPENAKVARIRCPTCNKKTTVAIATADGGLS